MKPRGFKLRFEGVLALGFGGLVFKVKVSGLGGSVVFKRFRV